jgi:hypothetical protein
VTGAWSKVICLGFDARRRSKSVTPCCSIGTNAAANPGASFFNESIRKRTIPREVVVCASHDDRHG